MKREDTSFWMLYTDRSEQYTNIYLQRYPVGLRPSSGRASAGVPYIGQPPVLYFARLCPTSAGARPELGRCPLKNLVLWLSQMHGTPADTRPCIGRCVFRCGYDGLRWGSSVRARWNLAPKLKFHRAATDVVLSNKRHGCPAGVRPVFGRVRWKSHRWLIGTASARLYDWAICMSTGGCNADWRFQHCRHMAGLRSNYSEAHTGKHVRQTFPHWTLGRTYTPTLMKWTWST